jgi:hypothetical protein
MGFIQSENSYRHEQALDLGLFEDWLAWLELTRSQAQLQPLPAGRLIVGANAFNGVRWPAKMEPAPEAPVSALKLQLSDATGLPILVDPLGVGAARPIRLSLRRVARRLFEPGAVCIHDVPTQTHVIDQRIQRHRTAALANTESRRWT